jgi:Chaperone of endosialidase
MSNSRNFATLGSNSSSGGIVTNITSIGALTNSASSNTIYLFGVSNYQNNYIQSVFNTANSASSNTIYLQGALNQTNNNIVNANTQLKAYVDGAFYTKSGGNISGPVIINSSLLVTGNLTVSGNVVTVSANNLSVQDNMIYLNQGDTGYLNPDLGFAGAYNDGTYHHAGFFRDHTTGVWKVFDNYLPEPDASPWIDQSNSSFRIANFQANTVTANLFSGSGASLTSLSANNLSGTIPSGVLGNSTQYIGTTAVALNRASGSQTLTGISIDGNAGTATTATTANALTTSNNYQMNSLGVGTAGSGTAGEIRATNNITAYYSDDRLKTRLGNIENALDKVRSLQGFYYEANELAQSMGYKPVREVGLSAQDTQKNMPEIVKPAPIDEKYLTVQYERYAPFIVESIKELADQIDEIKKHLGM